MLKVARSTPGTGHTNIYRARGAQGVLLMRVKKVKSSMARSLPVENLLPQNVGSIINYLQ